MLALLLPNLALAAQVQATITTPEIVVREKGQLVMELEAGSEGLQVGDQVRIQDPIFHGMRWSKWGELGTEPSACTPLSPSTDGASMGLVSAEAPSGAEVEVVRETSGLNIHEFGYTVITVSSGEVAAGERLQVRFGDPEAGTDCGFQFPDRAFVQVPLLVSERLDGATAWTEADAPLFDLVAGPAAALLVTAPSYTLQDAPMEVKVTVLDAFGNPVKGFVGQVKLSSPEGEQSLAFDSANLGWMDMGLKPSQLGVLRIDAKAGPLSAQSNPILVVEELPELQLYWGDIHVHHGHHYTDEEGVTINQNHSYARDAIGLDVVSESMKWEPIELNGAALWTYLTEDCLLNTSPDYLVLRGAEWMGLNPDGTAGSGHHNIYYDACNVPENSQTMLGLSSQGGLYDTLRALESAQGVQAVAVPHATRFTGHDWTGREDVLRPAAEIYSEWGNSAEPLNVKGSISEGIGMGNRFGFIAASDNHDGWMGNGMVGKNAPGGLAAFWAPSLDRASIFQSLATRQTYATSGARIVLSFGVEDGGAVRSGEEYVAKTPRFQAQVYGTSTITEIQLIAIPIQDDAEAEFLFVDYPEVLDATLDWTWEDYSGEDFAVWMAVTQEDGESAWSSPIWFTSDCERGALDPAGRCGPQETGETGDTAPTDSTPADSMGPPGSRCSCAAVPSPLTGVWGLGLGLLLLLRRRQS